MSFNDVQKTYMCNLQIPSCAYQTKNMKEFAGHYRMNHRSTHGILKLELFSSVIGSTCSNPVMSNTFPQELEVAPWNSGYQLKQYKICSCDLLKKYENKKNYKAWTFLRHILTTHPCPEGIYAKFHYCSNHKAIPLAYEEGPINKHVKRSGGGCSLERGVFYYNGTDWELTDEKTLYPINEVITSILIQIGLVPSKKRNGSLMEDSPKKIRIREDLHDAEAAPAVVHDLFPEALLPHIPTNLYEVPQPEPIVLPPQ